MRYAFAVLCVIFNVICFSATFCIADSVLLISVDTLRSDKVGAYGEKEVYTPWIDKLVKLGVQFDTTLTTVPRTNPSFASMFTSKMPSGNKVRSLKDTFEPFNNSIAEIFENNGYYTAAVTSNPLMGVKSGFAQGFEYYYNNPAEFDVMNVSSDISKKTVEMLDKLKDREFFLWVHFSDPHYPYKPPYPYDIIYQQNHEKSDASLKIYDELEKQGQIKDQLYFFNKLTKNENEHLKYLYHGTVTYTDKEIGKIITKLHELDIFEDVIIIFISDHGESLGEHDYYYEHGDFTYNSTVKIPLILKSSNFKKGTLIQNNQISVLDILPTISEMCGLKLDGFHDFDGLSLVQLIDNGFPLKREYLLGESGFSFYPKNSRREIGGVEWKWRFLCTEDWKLILKPMKDEEGKTYYDFELYDLKNDPQETRNIYSDKKDNFEIFKTILEESLSGDLNSNEVEIPEELKTKLRSLGYM